MVGAPAWVSRGFSCFLAFALPERTFFSGGFVPLSSTALVRLREADACRHYRLNLMSCCFTLNPDSVHQEGA